MQKGRERDTYIKPPPMIRQSPILVFRFISWILRTIEIGYAAKKKSEHALIPDTPQTLLAIISAVRIICQMYHPEYTRFARLSKPHGMSLGYEGPTAWQVDRIV